MIALELPHINVLSKCDLMDKEEVEKILDTESATQLWQMEEENVIRASGFGKISASSFDRQFTEEEMKKLQKRRKQNKLTVSICTFLDDFSMVSFLPMDITDEDSIDLVLAHADHCVQYGENVEVRGADFPDFEDAGDD